MTNHNNDANLTEITVADSTNMPQDEIIAQLRERISDMEAEMKRTQELTNLATTANLPGSDHERPPIHFPSPDPSHQHVSISTNPQIIHVPVTLDEGPSHVFSQFPHNAQTDSTSRIAHIIQPQAISPESQAPDKFNLPSAQTVFSKIPLKIPIFNNPYIPNSIHPEVDKEKERELNAKEEKAKLGIMKEEIAKAMKQFHYTPDVVGLDYEDLCIHPKLNLPEGFKVPKFDTFNGSGNPLSHLRAYCDQLVGVGKNEALLMRLFNRSLSGEAMEWFTSQETNHWANWSVMAKDFVERFAYNVEIMPDRYSLEKIKQKPTESYREYAYRWRKDAARVRPPMSENEIIEVFVRSQEPEFYERMMLLVGVKFADIVKIGENIEDGLKTGRITHISNSVGTSGILKRKNEDVLAISGIQGNKRTPGSHPKRSTPPRVHFQPTLQYHPPPYHQSAQYQTPLPVCSYVQSTHQNPSTNYPAQRSNYQTSPFQTPTLPSQNYSNYRQMPPPHPNADKKTPRVFTPLAESRTKLFERLSAIGLIQPAPPRAMDANARFFRGDQICAYHSNSVGHDTENCISLKYKIQDLIDRDAVVLRTVTTNANENLLPDHEGNMAGMVEGEGDCHTVESSTSNYY